MGMIRVCLYTQEEEISGHLWVSLLCGFSQIVCSEHFQRG